MKRKCRMKPHLIELENPNLSADLSPVRFGTLLLNPNQRVLQFREGGELKEMRYVR